MQNISHSLSFERVLAFNLDDPLSAYGFTTRLVKENFWSRDFAKRAIVEYKKFMFLAATSDLMVSPSPVVDVVWHQHLVFTQSYARFGELLGKQIQHIPSTKSKLETDKFRAARERTKTLYMQVFGPQPDDIWHFHGMYESLRLDKAKVHIRTFVLFGLLAVAALISPAYFLLLPMYVHISGPDFLVWYGAVAVMTFILLNVLNASWRERILERAHSASFIFRLQPSEVVYLKTMTLSNVIDSVLHQMMVAKKITATDPIGFAASNGAEAASEEEFQVLDILREKGSATYSALLEALEKAPAFHAIRQTGDAVNKFVVKSGSFGWMFYFNFGALAFVWLLGFVRVVTGVSRDKPVTLIVFLLCIFTLTIISFLRRLTRRSLAPAVSSFYKKKIKAQGAADWQWKYAIEGPAVFVPAFVAACAYGVPAAGGTSTGHSSGSSSCGSSCGSSCSSCGGCGGGD